MQFLFSALGRDVADFITKLLVKDPRKRLGGGEEDARELKKHAFFKNLDWNKLARKELPAPFKPVIKLVKFISQVFKLYYLVFFKFTNAFT